MSSCADVDLFFSAIRAGGSNCPRCNVAAPFGVTPIIILNRWKQEEVGKE